MDSVAIFAYDILSRNLNNNEKKTVDDLTKLVIPEINLEVNSIKDFIKTSPGAEAVYFRRSGDFK
jgi:hypothetical protein